MTDIIVVFFLIGISVLFSILLFFKHNALIAVISALSWGLLGLYNFNRFYSGVDPDAGIMVYSFGWFCIAMAIILITSPLWLFKKVAVVPDKGDEREDWEIEDERRQKRIKYLNRYRPRNKPRNKGIWSEE
jgi:hypothetical protein